MSKREEYNLGTLFNVSFVSPQMVGCAVVLASEGRETFIGDLAQGDIVVIMSNNMRRSEHFEEVFVRLGWFPSCYIIELQYSS